MAKNISNLDKSLKQNITPADIGAATASHGTHVTYSTAAPKVAGTAAVGSAANVARGDHVHPAQTSVSGNAGTATKLQTARNISLGGVLSGSASFDGSANASISASIAKPPKSGDWFSGGIPTVNSDGVMEIGKYIDFHNTDASTNDYDVRLQANTSTPCVITLPTAAGTLARTADNVASATKLQTARTIQIGNKSNTFDGSANISYTLADIGAAASSHGTHLSLGTTSSTAYRGDYGNTAYNHSQAAHAPSNAQKNSDITKAEIEAKLTGNITSHTHSSYATTTTTNNLSSSIGTLSNLQTSAKGNLVAAINELFQSGNNIKQQLVDIIIANGGSASTNDSMDSLIEFLNQSMISNKQPASYDNISSNYWVKLKGSEALATLTSTSGAYNVWNNEVYCGTYCKYNPRTDTATLLGGSSYSQGSYTLAVDDNNIYVFTKGTYYVYNLTTKTKTTYSGGLKTYVDGYGITAENIRGKIYTMGNCENVVKYDPATNTFSNLPVYHTINQGYTDDSEYTDFISTKFKDRYYVVQSCGYEVVDTGKSYHNCFTMFFDVEENKWKYHSTTFSHSSINGRFCATDEVVYKIGGYYSSSTNYQTDLTYNYGTIDSPKSYSYISVGAWPSVVTGGVFFAIDKYLYYYNSSLNGYVYSIKVNR